jgi:sorting nexin-8
MSLFGSSPDEHNTAAISSKSRNSLFDDEPSPAPGSKSSLFADDDGPNGSPWGLPTPQKAKRGELIQTLLPASEVPDSYIDTFDNVLRGGDGVGGKVGAAGVAKVLSAGSLSADDQSRIVNVIAKGGQIVDLSRNEFNVLLALVGLAQENEDITLDGVDERRKSKSMLC